MSSKLHIGVVLTAYTLVLSVVLVGVVEGLAQLFYEPRPETNMAHRAYGQTRWPNLTQERYEGEYLPTTDAFGFQGDPMELVKPPDVFRIIVVGASVPEGLAVEPKKRYPQLLKKHLNEYTGGHPRIEVASLCFPGAGAVRSLVSIATRILNVQPDLVIQHDGGDILWPLDKGYEPTLMYAPWLKQSRPGFRDRSRFVQWIRSIGQPRSPEAKIDRIHAQLASIPETSLTDSELPSAQDSMAMIHRAAVLLRDAGVQYAITTQALLYKHDQPEDEARKIILGHGRGAKGRLSTSTARTIVDNYNTAIRAVATREGILLIDLAEAIPRDLNHFIGGVHPNATGHARMADAIFAVLTKAGIPAVGHIPGKTDGASLVAPGGQE